MKWRQWFDKLSSLEMTKPKRYWQPCPSTALRARVSGLIQIEIQNNNQANIAWRMLRYYQDIRGEHVEPIQQYLLYIGKERCRMPQTIQEPNLSYQYTLVDMHTIDCNALLERNTPDALVLAILCDFKGRPAEAVVREIGTRLRLLLHNDDRRFLDYFSMLEILGQNRDLEQQLKETKNMLTQIDVSRLPSFDILPSLKEHCH
ncbi:hypothetical protein [Thiothrix subterranea]|uniref:Uncharacterized protein n=1 Tax=Thiothrix subterranea TaxID=2735563 RepID=A0AA51MUA8_9GAMM|nr:hypothetical protein [Thiothrix subterranea]WML88592.1 hypothetical protein RCG00_09485 [Thiothrix subterranea]